MVSINIIWIQHRYRYYILYCNFYITFKFLNIFSIVFGVIKITTVCSVFGLRVTKTVHGFLYRHSLVHALWPRELSLSVPGIHLCYWMCARFRSTTVYRTSKFVRHGENGEQGRECTVVVRPLLSLSRMKNYVEFVVLIWSFGKTER